MFEKKERGTEHVGDLGFPHAQGQSSNKQSGLLHCYLSIPTRSLIIIKKIITINVSNHHLFIQMSQVIFCNHSDIKMSEIELFSSI